MIMKSSFRLAFCVIIISLGPFISGTIIGFTSSLSAQLALNVSLLSLISSIINAGGLLGSLISGPLLNYKGRRTALRLASVPALLGWIAIASAQDLSAPTPSPISLVILIIFGRFLSGIGTGMLLTVSSVYLIEIAPPSKRGSIGSLYQVGIIAGISFAYALGMYKVWYDIAWIMILPTALLFFLCFCLPDSHMWLIRQGKIDKALADLTWLRKDQIAAGIELQVMIQNVAPSKDQIRSSSILLNPCGSIPRELKSKLNLGIYLMIFQQLTGINAITFYTEPICQNFVPISQSSKCAFLLGLSQLAFSILACFLIDRFSRRSWLIFTGLLMAISMMLFAVGQQFGEIIPISPITSLVCFLWGYCVGWGPLPMLIVMELFPSQHRGAAGAAVSAANWIACFLVTQFFQSLVNLFGKLIAFGLFSITTIYGCLIVYYWLPETNQHFIRRRDINLIL